LLRSIERIVKAEAAAAGAPREPRIERFEGANALVNDPEFSKRVTAALSRELLLASRALAELRVWASQPAATC